MESNFLYKVLVTVPRSNFTACNLLKMKLQMWYSADTQPEQSFDFIDEQFDAKDETYLQCSFNFTWENQGYRAYVEQFAEYPPLYFDPENTTDFYGYYPLIMMIDTDV